MLKKFGIYLIKRLLAKQKQERLKIEDIQPGERVVIEWDQMVERIGDLLCVNNDPETSKILLEITWNKTAENEEWTQRIIFDYNDDVFRNFHLLNKFNNNEKITADNPEIISLQKNLNEALEKENYEEACTLRDKINHLLNK